MTVKDLEALFDYSSWANEKFFEVISQLTDEQFIQPVAGSYGSIRNTLVHVLSAEWGPGVSRNPFLQFTLKSARAGDKVSIAWKDSRGDTRSDETTVA